MIPQTRPKTIGRVELLRRLNEQPPANEDRTEGYALVNVLEPEVYAREHIPNSINIPAGKEDEFERQFDKIDANSDGRVSSDELKKAALPDSDSSADEADASKGKSKKGKGSRKKAKKDSKQE